MKPFAKTALLSVAAFSLPALAEEQGFDNFLLSSPSIVSPSQYYQVKGGRFEALAGLGNGKVDSKGQASKTSTDVTSQNLGAGYAMGLSNQLVLGADVRFNSTKNKASGKTTESSDTEIRPTLAFSLSPIFSLGASINVHSGKDDNGVKEESSSYNTFSLGGTLHHDLWEASLALTTKNKDDKKTAENSPQALVLHGRYRILPVLALGFRLDQADYPGIETAAQSLETETRYSVIVESAVSDQASVDVAFTSISNENGDDGTDATEIFLGGAFKLASNMELGAQLRLRTGDADTYKYSVNSYALTFTSRQ